MPTIPDANNMKNVHYSYRKCCVWQPMATLRVNLVDCVIDPEVAVTVKAYCPAAVALGFDVMSSLSCRAWPFSTSRLTSTPQTGSHAPNPWRRPPAPSL